MSGHAASDYPYNTVNYGFNTPASEIEQISFHDNAYADAALVVAEVTPYSLSRLLNV